jgi:hypothetical protein
MKYSKEKEQFQKIFGSVLKRKYKSIKSIKTDEFVRDIFLNISNEDALYFLGKEGGVRTALLSCNNEHIKFN